MNENGKFDYGIKARKKDNRKKSTEISSANMHFVQKWRRNHSKMALNLSQLME